MCATKIIRFLDNKTYISSMHFQCILQSESLLCHVGRREIIGLYNFLNDAGGVVTINGDRYRGMLQNFFH